MQRLQEQADALLNVADDLDPPHPIPKTPDVVLVIPPVPRVQPRRPAGENPEPA
jgi:hypothetical protein